MTLDLLPRRRPRPGTAARPGPAPAPTEGLRVLFLGSSRTYAHDMPSIVQAFARAAGERLDVVTVAQGGASLEDHWNNGGALRKIQAGGWSVVVLQQGPSTSPAGRENLREYARRFAAPIRKVGARPALFMVWPAANNPADFAEIRKTYTLAAEDVDGMLLPAGEAWRSVWQRDPQVPLVKPDGVHPTPVGSFTLALSIYGMLFDRSPVGLPARVRFTNGKFAQVSPSLAPVLQEGAAEANAQFGRR